MCLFSFEQGNCVLPTANGTWASKDLSSVWNVEPTNSPQVCNLTKYMLSPSCGPNLSWFSFTSQLAKCAMEYSRRKKSCKTEKKFWHTVLSWAHQNAIQGKRKWEKLCKKKREKGREREMDSETCSLTFPRTESSKQDITSKLNCLDIRWPVHFFPSHWFPSTKILFQWQGCKLYS